MAVNATAAVPSVASQPPGPQDTATPPLSQPPLRHRSSDPELSDMDLADAVGMSERADWADLAEPVYADKDFEILRAPPRESTLPMYYIKGWLPYSADTLFNVLADVQYRKVWDTYISRFDCIDHLVAREVMYCAVSLPWPFASRDYVYHRRAAYFDQQTTFVILCKACSHRYAPEPSTASSSTVRVETFAMRLTIRATGTNGCEFSMEYEDDTNFSIPNYAVNWLLSANVPGFLTHLRKACAGYPAYVKTIGKGNGNDDHEGFISISTPSQLLRKSKAASIPRMTTETSPITATNTSSSTHISQSATGSTTDSTSPTSDMRTETSTSSTELVSAMLHSPMLAPSPPSPHKRNSSRRLHHHLLFRSTSVKSDKTLSPSNARGSRTRRLFRRRFGENDDTDRNNATTDLDVSRHHTSTKDQSIKHSTSLRKLFTSKNMSPKASKASTTTALLHPRQRESAFTVTFHRQTIGLHLETDTSTSRVVVACCEQGSEAALHSRRIRKGMLVTSINGQSIAEISFADLSGAIQQAARPLLIGFDLPLNHEDDVEPAGCSVAREGTYRQLLQCMVGRDDLNLLQYLRPCDEKLNRGAVLTADFRGWRIDKQTSKAMTASLSPTSRLASMESLRSSRCSVNIPNGCILYEVDHCLVLNLPFGEIAHLLSRNARHTVVSFQHLKTASYGNGSLSVTPSNDTAGVSSRSATSKKVSRMLRWRMGSGSGSKSGSASGSVGESDDGGVSTTSPLSTAGSHVSVRRGILHHSDTCAPTIHPTTDANTQVLPSYSHVALSSQDIAWAWKHVQLLKAEERIFSAAMLIDKIEAFSVNNDQEIPEVKGVLTEMHAQRELVHQIKSRRDLGATALHEFNCEEAAEWIFGQTYFGVSTHWKPGDDGTVWIKLDGLVEGVDIFNTIAVMREIDLYSCWVPFCNQSQMLHQASHVDILAYISIVVPLLRRDAVIHAIGINACYESRCILLLGGSADASTLPKGVNVPKLGGWNADRLELRAFRVLIEPITRTKARACIVCNIDPKCPIPKSLLNFGIKKLAGVLLFLIRKEAEKIEKVQQARQSRATSAAVNGAVSEHIARLDSDPDGFYAWLRPLVDRWFADLHDDRLPPRLTVPLPTESLASNSQKDSSSRSREVKAEFLCEEQVSDSMASAPPVIRSRNTSSAPTASHEESHVVSPDVHVTMRRQWRDYLYDFAIWPYLLLILFTGVTADDSLAYVCAVKFVFTCTCTWFAVPGAYSWQARQLKRGRHELVTLRRRCVLLAAGLDVLSSWALHIWVHWLLCYVSLIHVGLHDCLARTPRELRESENWWLLAAAYAFATAVVAIQVIIHI